MRHGRGCLGAVIVLLLVTTFQARARADEESPELRARTYFAAARYQEALDIYARLYAETLHPTYLRNIGRCYQRLGDPDKAISSFQEYLKKARELSREQRAEIEGYIADMEQLKKARAAAAVPPPAPTPRAEPEPPSGSTAATGAVSPPPAPAPPPDTSSPALLDSSADVTKRASDAETSPFYTRWWFWVTVAAVAAAGITTAVLLSAGGDPSHGSVGALDLTDKNP